MDRTITTEEAARLAGVTASTIKRWADEGGLPCVRTAGGHRRFRSDDVRAFLTVSGAPALPVLVSPAAPSEWIRVWRSGQAQAVDASLLLARSARGSWYAVAEAVGAAMTELGEQWASNSLTVADEHVVSAALQRSLSRIAHSLPVGTEAPRCVLATPDGEPHVIGLSLAELCLREAGWETLWLGASSPVEEVSRIIAGGDVHLVALSASSFSFNAEQLEKYISELEPICDQRNVGLIAGGNGRWPDRVRRVVSFEALHQLAKGHSKRRSEVQ